MQFHRLLFSAPSIIVVSRIFLHRHHEKGVISFPDDCWLVGYLPVADIRYASVRRTDRAAFV